MFSLTLLAIIAVSCSANCLADGSATITNNKQFHIPIGANSACTAGSWINVSFSCGKTLNFRQKVPTPSLTSNTLNFDCKNFYSLTNDPNLICDFYQCLQYKDQKVVNVIYGQATQVSNSRSRALTQTETKALQLAITGELTPPEEVDTKDKDLMTIIIVSTVAAVIIFIVFVVMCVLCKKKRTESETEAAKQEESPYKEHPKNEILIDIVNKQKKYEDSENTDEFYMNLGDSGAIAVASDNVNLLGHESNRSHTIDSGSGGFKLFGKKNRSGSKTTLHDESFTTNRIFKPASDKISIAEDDN